MVLESSQNIIDTLLSFEHAKIAAKLGFTNKASQDIDKNLLCRAIGLIDCLSRESDQASKNIAVCLIAILWEYKKPEWDGLKDTFILFLSRMGFAPTATMTDAHYNEKEMTHAALQSYITELTVALHQAKYEICIKKQKFLLTEFQKEIWDKIDKNKVMGISAPTSAGKTFIILLKIIEMLLQKDGTVVYIIPNLSLMSQIAIDLQKLLKRFNLTEYEILTSFYSDYGDKRKIFVLTQERAIAAFSQTQSPFPDLRVFVIDEIQNIEKVANDNDQRSKILFDAIFEFRQQTTPDKVILSGPRVGNIKGLSEDMFQIYNGTDYAKTLTSPVVNFTYSVSGTPKKMKFRQYSCITDTYNEIAIENPETIVGIGQKRYTPEFHEYLNLVICSFSDMVNLIFSPTPKQARKTALALNTPNKPFDIDEKLKDLITYIAETVHSKYDLCATLSNMAAYHHGQLPSHVRRIIDKAITEKIIKTIVCTTTLMQGVNLPVQNIIVRNPNLFIKSTDEHESAKLSGYEFANLRGRAGRLLKDFIGRAFVLDEKSFEKDNGSNETSLFDDETKELRPQYAYSDTFNKYQTGIQNDLENHLLPGDQPYHYLLPYIRQSIYKYGERAKARLQAVGIFFDDVTFDKIQTKLKSLSIPVEICYQNRYWDPLDLDSLFRKYNNNEIAELPTHQNKNISHQLYNLLLYFYENYPYYCKKYNFGKNDFAITKDGKRGNLWRICYYAEKWKKEISLFDIFNTPYFSGDDISDKIDDAVSVINKKVSYGLPMLLKPLADFNESKNAILNYIEMGAYHPATRKLIELGVPRETAIYLKNDFFSSYKMETESELMQMIKFIKLKAPDLNYWVQVQLECITG